MKNESGSITSETNTEILNTNDLYNVNEDDFKAFLAKEGYTVFKKLPDGEWVAIMPLAFSTSVCCGIDYISPFKYRWCFKKPSDAVDFYNELKEFDEIPDNQEGLVGHRYGALGPRLILKDAYGNNRW